AWLVLGPSRAATSGLVRGTATRGPTAEQRTAARRRSSQVSQRPVDAAPVRAEGPGPALSSKDRRVLRSARLTLGEGVRQRERSTLPESHEQPTQLPEVAANA